MKFDADDPFWIRKIQELSEISLGHRSFKRTLVIWGILVLIAIAGCSLYLALPIHGGEGHEGSILQLILPRKS